MVFTPINAHYAYIQGMAVDYLLHLVHSYKQQKEGNSHDRVRAALKQLGVSVTSGMITTFMACIALVLTNMLWFKLFGYFIMMVTVSAFVISIVGLMALLAEFGPGDVGGGVDGGGGVERVSVMILDEKDVNDEEAAEEERKEDEVVGDNLGRYGIERRIKTSHVLVQQGGNVDSESLPWFSTPFEEEEESDESVPRQDVPVVDSVDWFLSPFNEENDTTI
jgi:hypothetical protein